MYLCETRRYDCCIAINTGEADVPFFYASGSEFDEVFVGTGARRVRSLFGKLFELISIKWGDGTEK